MNIFHVKLRANFRSFKTQDFVPPHKRKISCFNNVFLCTFHCTLRKSVEYPHTFSVHTLAKIDLVRSLLEVLTNAVHYQNA